MVVSMLKAGMKMKIEGKGLWCLGLRPQLQPFSVWLLLMCFMSTASVLGAKFYGSLGDGALTGQACSQEPDWNGLVQSSISEGWLAEPGQGLLQLRNGAFPNGLSVCLMHRCVMCHCHPTQGAAISPINFSWPMLGDC